MEDVFWQDLEDAIETRQQIAQAEQDEFVKRWQDKRFLVPVELIDFAGIYVLMEMGTSLLKDETVPMVKTAELTSIMGELADPFVDYVNSSRKSIALQGISVFTSLGYLEPTIDESGELGYTKTTKQGSRLVRDSIEKALKIYERF